MISLIRYETFRLAKVFISVLFLCLILSGAVQVGLLLWPDIVIVCIFLCLAFIIKLSNQYQRLFGQVALLRFSVPLTPFGQVCYVVLSDILFSIVCAFSVWILLLIQNGSLSALLSSHTPAHILLLFSMLIISASSTLVSVDFTLSLLFLLPGQPTRIYKLVLTATFYATLITLLDLIMGKWIPWILVWLSDGRLLLMLPSDLPNTLSCSIHSFCLHIALAFAELPAMAWIYRHRLYILE